MNWQLVTFLGLALVLLGGFGWYERSRPPARLVALVAALSALAVAGRLVLAPIPNVVATTDIALITGYALGGAPGFAVGALAAPISNVWLGQGPWTPWEMAGWGLVGLAGALIAALTRRRLGRLGLATVCGLAGFAYGALLDYSLMATYGGEQSLDRYLALSARGIPFNVAHAAGNFAIALAAGPALARMISRYRTRFEFTWRPAGAGALGAMLIALAVTLAAGGAASPPASARQTQSAPLERAAVGESASWLAATQNSDGGFGATLDYPSSPAMTGWVALGMEAAGRNPLDLRAGGDNAVSYLRSQSDRLKSVGDLERTILALTAAGVEPRGFAGVDLVSELRDRRDGDGSVDGQVNLTAFFVLAMRAAGIGPSDLSRSASWLREAQNADGGFGIQLQAPSEADSTGAALQALAAAGPGGDALSDGARYLRRAQRGDGSWALGGSGVANSQSTAWAVQGLAAAGSGGAEVRRALGYLDSLRAPDGHYSYSQTSDQTPIWVTAQVLLAIERRPFPIAAVARRERSGGSGSGSNTHAGGAGAGSQPGATPAGGSAGGGGGGAATAPAGSRAGGSSRAGGGGGDGSGVRGDLSRGDGPQATAAGRPGAPVAAAPAEPPAAELDDGDSTAPYVAGGFAALALALGAGFFWYRRRLP